MLELTDSIEIRADADRVVDWLQHLDENYREWHPDHVKAEFVTGGFEEGDICYTEEYLHGRLHKLSFRLTRVERDAGGCKIFDYEMLGLIGRIGGVGGSFIIQPMGASSLFTATLRFRGGTVMGRLFGSQLTSLRQHMKEEGQNLKTAMEQTSEVRSAATS